MRVYSHIIQILHTLRDMRYDPADSYVDVPRTFERTRPVVRWKKVAVLFSCGTLCIIWLPKIDWSVFRSEKWALGGHMRGQMSLLSKIDNGRFTPRWKAYESRNSSKLSQNNLIWTKLWGHIGGQRPASIWKRYSWGLFLSINLAWSVLLQSRFVSVLDETK
jgi:hypothetical protein